MHTGGGTTPSSSYGAYGIAKSHKEVSSIYEKWCIFLKPKQTGVSST